MQSEDNYLKLYESFTKEYGEQHPGGYIYKCRKCGCSTYTEEFWCPIEGDWVPIKVVCGECHRRWVNTCGKVTPTDRGVIH